MYRKREAQGDLLKETAWIFGDQKVQALQKSWAGKFREQCLGMLDESPFVGLYSEKGRPCTSVRVLLGVMVLQACRDMSDQQALDALTFDVRWQYALAVGMDEVAPSRRTLVGFRGKVMEGDYLSVLFHVQVGKLMEMCNGIHGLQRMDSTEVVSRVRALTRLQNLVALMQKVLQGLSRHAPELLASAPQSLRLRYRTSCGDDAGFGDVPATKARRRLSVVARDLGRLVTALDAWPGPISPKLADTLALLRKMVNEQCELLATPESGTGDDEDAGEAPVAYRLRPKEMIPRDAVQTPHDPDLRRSGKSGNAVHRVVITETCAPPPAPDAPADAVAAPAIITDIRVEDGHATDQGCAEAVLETLSEQGYTPGQLLADAAFCGQAHVEACAELGTELIGPVPGHTPNADSPSLVGWTRDADRTLRCPAGHTPAEDTGKGADWPLQKRWRAKFSPAVCQACPHSATCAARPMKRKPWWQVVTDDIALLAAQRRVAQDTEQMRRLYARRAGCEATVFELKHMGGMGRLRVRGRPRVTWWCQLIAYATNFSRWVRHCMRCERAAAAAKG